MYQNKETVIAFDPEDARRLGTWSKANKWLVGNAAGHLSAYISNHLEELLEKMDRELHSYYE